MATLTLFFNSDSDISLSNTDTVYGLDQIPTGSRAHLISKLSIGNASFFNRNAWSYLSPDDHRLAYNLHYGPCISINGPGSGYFLSDSKFTDPSYSLKLTDEQFNNRWKHNTYRTLNLIQGQFPQKDETFFDDDIALNEYPKDWLLSEFLIIVNTNPPPYGTDPSSITNINLVGWGRGAVSCHMLANYLLNSSLASAPINILAIDPIIGSAVNSESIHTTLGANVQEYVGFYARDERSASLPCIVPDTAPNTRVHIYPIAGRHTTLIGNQAADGESRPGTFSEPADLVFYLAMKCLNRWDPTLSINTAGSGDYPDLSVNGNQVLAKIKSEYDDYVNMRNTTYSNQSQEVKGDRQILLNGQFTNFKSAQGTRFTPSQGLAKGHIEDMSYFQDIT